MSVRVVVAGLLVGVLGILTTFAAHFAENLIFHQIEKFIQNYPEAFPLPPHQATFWSWVVTLWIGLLFGFLYSLARPAGGLRAAALLGLVCWLGFVVPFQALQFLWTQTSLYALGASAVGYLLQLVLGGLILARMLKPAQPAASETVQRPF
ncbi:MAG: hypothetical protein ACE5H2_08265 [Terriglobia bacterium]